MCYDEAGNYHFRRGDKLTTFCKGKYIQRMSVNRLSDAGLENVQPIGLTVAIDGTYYFADNVQQKIYKLNLNNEIIFSIDYSDISAEITEISGLSIQKNYLYRKNRRIKNE